MDHVATSLGLSARRGQMLESFQTIFESMSRSLELVGLRRPLLLQEQQQQQQQRVLGNILRMFLR